MRSVELSLLLCALALPLTACESNSLRFAPPAPDAPWTPAITADGEIIPGEAAQAAARRDGYVLPSNPNAAASAGQPTIDTANAYTLPELIDLAESHNPATRVAWETARNAALAVGVAKAAYLPNLSASVVGAYQSASSDLTIPGGHGSGDSSLHGSISALSVQWLLFDFGERDGVVHAAQQLSTVANLSFTAVHQQVIYRVSLAYYTYAAALSRLTTANKALENAKAIETAAEARRAQGLGTVVEVAQAHQVAAQSELARTQAQGQTENTYVSLIAALGLSPLATLKIAPVAHRPLPSSMSEPVARIVSEALARRPDVLGAYAAHAASMAKFKAAKAEFLPKLFLSATGSYTSTGFDVSSLPGFGQQPATINVAGSRWGGTILLGVTMPLYDGGVRRALESQARADEARSDATLESVRDEAAREVISAATNLRTSLEALDASEALANASQVTFDAALDAFRHGVGSITDATRAETALLESRTAAADAYSAALIAAATLALSAGTLGTSPE